MLDSEDLRMVVGTVFWATLPYLFYVMQKRPAPIKVSLNRVGWPLLGTFRRTESDWHQKHANMKRNGDVFSSSLDSENVVVLNSEKAINEVFDKLDDSGNESSNLKHKSLFFTHGLNSGLQPKLAVCNFDLHSIEWKIKLEMRHFLNLVEGYHGCQLDFDKIMDRSAANVMCLLLFGRILEYGANELMTFIALLNETSNSSARDSVAFQKAMDICRNEIEQHRRTFSEDRIRDYLDENLKQMRISGSSALSDEELSLGLLDVLIAGTEAVSNGVMWSMYALAAHPHLKEQLHKEVDALREVEPSLSHRASMPLVRAFVAELLRWKSVVPVSAVKRASRSVKTGDFIIPEGSKVVANFWAVDHDPDTWVEPLALRPERFLAEDGSLKPCLDTGRCVGESVVRPLLFLYVSSLLQPFDVTFLPGVRPHVQRDVVRLNRPINFQICMPLRRPFVRQFS